MRLIESIFIKEIIEGCINNQSPIKTFINLGCGDIEQLQHSKPWINDNVIHPLNIRNIKIINLDIFKYDSVDYVADLSHKTSLEFIKKTEAPRLLLLGNVLEHVPSNLRTKILNNIFSSMANGDKLIISVPNDYPYHADPIDTLYRPSPDQIKTLLPLDWDVCQILECGSYYDEFKKMVFLKKIRKILKPFWIFQSPKKWLESHRLLFLFKKYKILVLLGTKK
jgi:hypothetical protein